MEKVYNKNYVVKIQQKTTDLETAQDINCLIVLINYCFHTKNNFFITNFNKKVLPNIYLAYNKIKTNILNENEQDIFCDVNIDGIKAIKFVLTNLLSNFSNTNTELCSIISKDSLKRLISILEKNL